MFAHLPVFFEFYLRLFFYSSGNLVYLWFILSFSIVIGKTYSFVQRNKEFVPLARPCRNWHLKYCSPVLFYCYILNCKVRSNFLMIFLNCILSEHHFFPDYSTLVQTVGLPRPEIVTTGIGS